MASGISINVHEAALHTPAEVALLERSLYRPTTDAFGRASEQRRYLAPPSESGMTGDLEDYEQGGQRPTAYRISTETRLLTDTVLHRLVELTDAVLPSRTTRAKQETQAIPGLSTQEDVLPQCDTLAQVARCPPWIAKSISEMVLDVTDRSCPLLRDGSRYKLRKMEIPRQTDIELGHGDEASLSLQPPDFANYSVWGSLFAGAQAGALVYVYVQPCNDGYESIKGNGLNYYARIIRTRDDFPHEPSKDSPLYLPLHLTDSLAPFPGTCLYLSCRFRKAGTYTFNIVWRQETNEGIASTMERNNELNSSMKSSNVELPVGWGPRSFTISPGPAFAPNCVTDPETNRVDGLAVIDVTPGQLQSLMLKTVDRFGNDCHTGQDGAVEVFPIGGVRVSLLDNLHNGQYEIRYMVPNDQSNAVSALRVLVNGVPLYGGRINLRCPGVIKSHPSTHPFRLKQEQHTVRKLPPHSTDLPIPPTCPPYPNLMEIKRSLPPSSLSLLVPTMVVQMENYEAQLLNACHGLVDLCKQRSDKSSPLDPVLACKDTVAINQHKLQNLENMLDALEKDIIEVQKHLQKAYALMRLNTVEKLPVTIELDDPDEIRELHREERQRLKEMQKDMSDRLEKMKERYAEFLRTRESFTHHLTSLIVNKEASVANQLRYLEYLKDKINKKTLHTLKRQLRREDRDACVPPAIHAQQIRTMRRDFVDRISYAALEWTPPKRQTYAREPPPTRLPEPDHPQTREKPAIDVIPNDPTNPAFWIAEGRFRKHIVPAEHGLSSRKKESHCYLMRTDRYGFVSGKETTNGTQRSWEGATERTKPTQQRAVTGKHKQADVAPADAAREPTIIEHPTRDHWLYSDLEQIPGPPKPPPRVYRFHHCSV